MGTMGTSETVRWGVLGVARVFERRMIPAFQAADGNTLIAIASRSQEKAEQAAARFGIPHAHGAYEALLDDPEVDAVYIPLPNDLHCEWTIRALQAGKHVLCDKPAAFTAADARAMANAAQSAGRRLQEGFMYRHHPQHIRLQEIIASGEIGDVVEVRGVFTYTADRSSRTNIRWNPAQGGGALLDTGVYPLNAARYFLAAEPVAVMAVAARDPEFGVDLHTTALLEFPEGRTATLTGGFDQAFATRLEVSGTKGAVCAQRAFQVGEKGVTLSLCAGDAEREERFPHVDQYALELEHFAACVRNPARSLWPGEDGAAQARVVEALRRSATERRRIELSEVN